MPLWLISILIGVVAAFIVTGTMRSQLKSVVRQSGAGSYQTPGSLHLTASTDIFLYQNTTRHPRSKNNKR